MVIKREIAEKHPWIVLNVLKAFDEANDVAEHRRMEHIEYHRAAGLLPDATIQALRQPLLQHGIKHNRLTLETAARYSLEQGLTPRLMKLDELFAASTLDE
jgi:4,5-dihydroxyphthalate decarboxylase